ncbi:MAG: hypothetical protein K2J12_08540 [Muribaculaceae bacterium]|nr:hypothetical protein [Muribaculaceae bacterium]
MNHSLRPIVYFLWISILFLKNTGCTTNYSPIESSLNISGSNQKELQKVLDYYADDSLKLEAAKYLIENMPGHFSFVDTIPVNHFYDSLDSLLTVMQDQPYSEIADSVKSIYYRNKIEDLETIDDICVIKSDFLIDNIDRAFEVWENVPWCRGLNFDEFCEYILPYKVAETQELKPWRAEYNAIIADSLERMMSCSLYRISAFQAAEFVNNCLKNEFCRDPDDQTMPPMFYRPLTRLRVPYSTCEDLCLSGISIFRAAGIPVAIDYVPLWGYGNRGHSWAIVRAPNGHDMPFVPIHMSPYVQHKINETISKVYRRTYARNQELVKLNDGSRFVPETFRNIFQRDVTPLYADTKNIDLKINIPDNEYAYLCTTSRSFWQPIAFTQVKDGKAKFIDMGKGCIYLPVYFDKNGNMISFTEPFKLDWDGSIQYLNANFDKTINATLYRKGPLLEYAWRVAVMMENGQFEASNSPDFKQSVTVGSVTTPADQAGEINIPDSIGSYRYWRYIQRGDSAKCYLGELTFINDSSNITDKGKVIGNFIESQNDILSDGRRAFDGDVLTPLSFTRPNEAWVGLDFGKPVSIDKIRYVPRSDGDMIEPGDAYELKYWHNGMWQTLDRKVATTVSIDFENIPSNTIYILRNLTKGKSERIFMIDEEGKQIWW